MSPEADAKGMTTAGSGSAASPALEARLEVDVQVAFDGFDLQVEQAIPAAGVTAVFGPSGSGKTTLLRSLLGFETRSRGRIALNGDVWLDSEAGVALPPHRRPVGCTFQDGRLFPHLDVDGNLDYADRRSTPAPGVAASITRDDVVDVLDLEPLLDRRPGTLSGGERQRAALGRALLSRPRLLLLDEPLSALDRRRKAEIMPYLLALHPRFGIPTLYVSHAVDEVALLADRVLVLAEGRVQAFGGTVPVLEQLDLAPLTERFQAAAVLEARVSAHDDEYRLTWLDLDGQRLSVPRIEHLAVGESARLLVRSRDVSLATERPSPTSIRNVLAGVLVSLQQDESTAFAEATVDLGSHRLRARITRASAAELGLAVGSPVFALLKSVSLDTRAGR